MTTKEALQSSEQGIALLAERGEIATDAGEGVGTLLAAEGPGDLLLHLDHAHVAFSLIVVAGEGKILPEGEHRVGPLQAVTQILGFALLAPPAQGRGRGRRGRGGGQAGGQAGGDGADVPPTERGARPGRQTRTPAARATSTAALIARSSAALSAAQGCPSCSSTQANSRRWCAVRSAWRQG